MKISIVTGFFLPVPPLRGGSTEKIWHRLSQEFSAAGHDVTLISRRWPGLPGQATVDGVQHVRVRGADHSRRLFLNLWRDFWWGIRVAARLPTSDVVICNTVTLPVWLRKFKPAVGRIAVVLARMPKGHGYAYRNVDLLLSLSEEVTSRLLRENPRLAGRIVGFPYPIDWTLHAQASAKSQPPAPITIGYVGRIHPEKGLPLLLAAASRLADRTDLPAWRLELVGPWTIPEGGGGEAYRENLLREFRGKLGARLILSGPQFDPSALAQSYGKMDIFCYPSIAEGGETFGVAVAEAMAAGAVPVVSNLACFNALVEHRNTGMVFDHRSPDAVARLATALAELLGDGVMRKKFAHAAQNHARQFDFDASARSVLAALTRLVGSRAHAGG